MRRFRFPWAGALAALAVLISPVLAQAQAPPKHPVKTVKVGGKTYRLGRQPSDLTRPRLAFAQIKGARFPTPPTALTWNTPAVSTVVSQLYLNDQLGDCVIAGGYHRLGFLAGQYGKPFIATDAQITADYSTIGGYVPGNPNTDQGCNIQDALTYWSKTGYADGSKDAAFASVDATNQTELAQALAFTGPVVIGIGLPDAWVSNAAMNSMKNGFVWDAAGPPDQNNGHCVVLVGYDAGGNAVVLTWGMYGTITRAALKKYLSQSAGGEAWAAINPTVCNPATGIAPIPALTWAQIQTDFAAITGTSPPPTPTPPVPPTPTPPVPTPPTPPVPTPPTPPTPPVGNGHPIIITIDGKTAMSGTYYSFTNRKHPPGPAISLEYGGRVVLFGVLVPIPAH